MTKPVIEIKITNNCIICDSKNTEYLRSEHNGTNYINYYECNECKKRFSVENTQKLRDYIIKKFLKKMGWKTKEVIEICC